MAKAEDFTVGGNADTTPVIFSYDQAANGNSWSDEAEKKRRFDLGAVRLRGSVIYSTFLVFHSTINH